MGGSITLEEKCGSGALFRFSIELNVDAHPFEAFNAASGHHVTKRLMDAKRGCSLANTRIILAMPDSLMRRATVSWMTRNHIKPDTINDWRRLTDMAAGQTEEQTLISTGAEFGAVLSSYELSSMCSSVLGCIEKGPVGDVPAMVMGGTVGGDKENQMKRGVVAHSAAMCGCEGSEMLQANYGGLGKSNDRNSRVHPSVADDTVSYINYETAHSCANGETACLGPEVHDGQMSRVVIVIDFNLLPWKDEIQERELKDLIERLAACCAQGRMICKADIGVILTNGQQSVPSIATNDRGWKTESVRKPCFDSSEDWERDSFGGTHTPTTSGADRSPSPSFVQVGQGGCICTQASQNDHSHSGTAHADRISVPLIQPGCNACGQVCQRGDARFRSSMNFSGTTTSVEDGHTSDEKVEESQSSVDISGQIETEDVAATRSACVDINNCTDHGTPDTEPFTPCSVSLVWVIPISSNTNLRWKLRKLGEWASSPERDFPVRCHIVSKPFHASRMLEVLEMAATKETTTSGGNVVEMESPAAEVEPDEVTRHNIICDARTPSLWRSAGSPNLPQDGAIHDHYLTPSDIQAVDIDACAVMKCEPASAVTTLQACAPSELHGTESCACACKADVRQKQGSMLESVVFSHPGTSSENLGPDDRFAACCGGVVDKRASMGGSTASSLASSGSIHPRPADSPSASAMGATAKSNASGHQLMVSSPAHQHPIMESENDIRITIANCVRNSDEWQRDTAPARFTAETFEKGTAVPPPPGPPPPDRNAAFAPPLLAGGECALNIDSICSAIAQSKRGGQGNLANSSEALDNLELKDVNGRQTTKSLPVECVLGPSQPSTQSLEGEGLSTKLRVTVLEQPSHCNQSLRPSIGLHFSRRIVDAHTYGGMGMCKCGCENDPAMSSPQSAGHCNCEVRNRMDFKGNAVSTDGLRSLPENLSVAISAVKNTVKPEEVDHVQRLGICQREECCYLKAEQAPSDFQMDELASGGGPRLDSIRRAGSALGMNRVEGGSAVNQRLEPARPDIHEGGRGMGLHVTSASPEHREIQIIRGSDSNTEGARVVDQLFQVGVEDSIRSMVGTSSQTTPAVSCKQQDVSLCANGSYQPEQPTSLLKQEQIQGVPLASKCSERTAPSPSPSSASDGSVKDPSPVQSDCERMKQATQTPAQLGKPLSGLEVLVAEDTDLLRKLEVTMLQRVGAKAIGVEDGKKAVDAIQQRAAVGSSQKQFDCVLMDCQLHYFKEHKHHAYSRLGGVCQAWLDNLLSKHGVVGADLHTKISWDDLKAAWHKRFQVEPSEIKAMDKLMVFEQGTLLSVDWIAEYQRLTSIPNIQMGFKAIKHYFISRSCPTLGNALTHVEDTLTTPTELFDKAAQVIVTNKEAKNLQRSSASSLSRDQHRPKVAVVAAATPNDQTSEAVSANEGDRLAAAREGGCPGKGRGRGKAKTSTASSPGPGAASPAPWSHYSLFEQAAPAPWSHYGLSEKAYKARTRFRYCLWQGQIGKLSTVGSDSTTLSTPSEPVLSRVTALRSKAHAEVDSPLLYSFEDYAARLVPTLGTHAQGQDVCAASSSSGSGDLSSSSGSSRDSAREFNIDVLDPLTSEDFAWLPLPTTGRLPGPQCAALCAHLHTYLFYAPPTSPTDDKVAVGDILAYVTKVAREFHNQRYDDNNAALLYVRIQVGQASCSALLDSGVSHNFMNQAFMQKAGLGTQVRRKANPTAIQLADGRTQQLIDRYIEGVPVYFAPHACEPVTFDILDTDFDIILGIPWLASADHTVNFHWQTLTVRDAFGAEVSCTIPFPHPSIRCQVVTAKSFRATCAYEQPNEIGLCFLRTVVVADSSPTDLSLGPRVVRLLDEFVDIFESPIGVVADRSISHKIILEASVVPPKVCIYRMSEGELTVLYAQLDDLLDKGWIRPSSSSYGAPVLFVQKNYRDLRLCIDYRKLNAQTVKNVGPFPRIDDRSSAKYFSKLDLKSGYHQILIRPNHRYKSAFKTRYGHFEWVVMPFGLTNAPTTFQATMTNEFHAMLDRFVLVYLDDILVYSRSLEDHLEHL
ncbi:hypothetical protein CBR_g8511 [Chara braunii]|uniref:Reverse transcriptase domain-containing protein n=1 Tax=Chara braunii TaxID=69332 RepID=A0A388KMI5_CHABU|nr:hypothetical protein CBR_g8511 [Chara braunii]|eukprot:GBG71208.1 hypothetical protein CBR_g8511 [Chara braunii]